MEYKPVVQGENIITLEKNGKFYGMTCAWTMQEDYDKIIMCLGDQSETGHAISKNDLVGISALANGQESIGEQIGSDHSSNKIKFNNVPFMDFFGVKVVKGAKTKMQGKVLNVIHLEEDPTTNLVYILIQHYEEDSNKKFLIYND